MGSEPPTPEDADSGQSSAQSPRVTIARRELASLKSEKTIVLALLIQLFVAMFSSFLVVGLVSLYDPGAEGGFEPEFGVTGNATSAVLAVEQGPTSKNLQLSPYDSATEATEAFRSGEVDAILAANWTAGGDQVRVIATAPKESIRTTLIIVKTRDVMGALERALRERYVAQGRLDVELLEVPRERPSSPYFGFTYTVLVPLLMFLPVFISGSIAVDSLTEEIQRGTLELLRAAPVSLSTIVDAKLLSTATLAPIQALLWLGLLGLNGTRIVHWPGLTLMVAGISMAVVAIGVGISLLAPDRQQAQFLYSSGILAIALVASLLPEHPANTIAKLAIGSATTSTWIAVGGYVAIGVGAYAAVRFAVGRIDPEGL